MSNDQHTELVKYSGNNISNVNPESFIPPEWVHLVESVELEIWDPYGDVPDDEYPGKPRNERRFNMFIKMRLDYDVLAVLKDKLINNDRIIGRGSQGWISGISVDHIRGNMNIRLVGYVTYER